MPFRKKNSKYWHYDFQFKGGRFYGSCGTEDFQTAKAVEAEARFNAKNSPQAHGKFTLSEALGTYYSDICKDQASAKTSFSQAKMLLTELPASISISDLTNRDIMGAVVRMRATRQNGTVNRHLDFLSRSLKHMATFYDAKVPTLDFKAAKTPEAKIRVRFLTENEEARLFEHLRDDLHDMVRFALMTGARQQAIFCLKWRDISDEITFANKGGGTYQFPVGRPLRALLSALPKSNVIEHRGYVFTFLNERGERVPFNQNNHWMWDRAFAAAEINNFRFHDLRHTFGTRMLRHTNNLKLVSELMGHSDVTTTARYAHVLASDKLSALDEFGAVETKAIYSHSRSKSRS